jgi:hypothetical protein
MLHGVPADVIGLDFTMLQCHGREFPDPKGLLCQARQDAYSETWL